MTGFIVLMASFMASVALSIDAMLPALKDIGEGLGVADMNHTQFIISALFAGMAVGQLLCGPYSDALGRKKVLYAGLGLYMAGSVICILAGSLPVLLAGRILQGFGAAAPYVSAIAIIRDRYSGDHMARVLSMVMMVFILVPSIAPALGQAVIVWLSWRWIFVLLLAVGAAMVFAVFFFLEETLPPKRRMPFDRSHIIHGFREVFATRVTAGYMLGMGLIFGAFTGYLNSTRQIFQDLFHTGPMFSLYFGGLALVFGAASLLNARIVERVGMRRLCRVAAVAVSASSALFLAYCAVFGDGLVPFLAYAAVLYCAMALLFGNLNAVAMEPMGHNAGIASAVIGSTSSVISLTFGTLIGQLFDGSLRPVTIGFLILGALCLAVIRQADAPRASRRAQAH